MIAFLEGTTVGADENRLFLNVNGVGFEIYMPARSLSRLDVNGSQVKIYTYMAVREDAMQLFGFLSRDDKKVFQLLLGVSGIGPKGALSVLSILSADDLRFAVLSEDVKAISAVPGLGKKTAQKLILELKDKFDLADTLSAKEESTEVMPDESGRREAVEALKALGYSASESMRAVNRVKDADTLSVEEILKVALREMGA